MDESKDQVFSNNIVAACKAEIPEDSICSQNKMCTPKTMSVPIKCEDLPKQRNRKVKRPYSPELMISHKRILDRKKCTILPHSTHLNITQHSNITDNKPFTCDLCKSPYIVNPTRSRLPRTKAKRKPGARKVVDPVLKKTLVVCNACGLAYGRNRTKKPKPEKNYTNQEDKTNYEKEAISFAKALANSLQEPLLERLYCPAYRLKPCHCLQSYIMGTDESCDEVVSSVRALQLLALLKKAKLLSKQKDVPGFTDHSSTDAEDANKSKIPRGAKLRRTQAFEDFVLTQRLYLRGELGFCERACQRVLMYSNNFLHKKVKSASDKGSRIEPTIGKNAAGALKPIKELASQSCCLDKCVMLASTHSKLLETWRKTASLGQRQARRVLAEMLTPTGGTKANCYKFVSMVTGCSYTTINLVNEHMRRTQGDREPPEHGLKRRQPPSEERSETGHGWYDLEIPSQEELRLMNSQQALAHLQQQQETLDRLKKQIADEQLLLEKQQALLNCTTPQRECEGKHKSVKEEVNVLNSPQLLNILKLPNTSATANVVIAKQEVTPPTISVMTSSGNFEPLGNISNISVSLPDSGSSRTTFSNVVIVPESSLDISNLGSRVCSESLVPAASYEVDVSSSPSVSQAASSSSYQLFTVMDAPGSTIFHFNN